MNEIYRLIKTEFLKFSKNTLLILALAMVICGFVVILLTDIDGKLPLSIAANFITNTTLIVFIIPLIIDYCQDIATGYFQDAISFGVSRTKLFFVKMLCIVCKSLCLIGILYICMIISGIIAGAENDIGLINYLRLALFSLCVIFIAFAAAVFFENTVNTTIACIVLGIGLQIFGSLFNDTFLQYIYIYGKSNLIFARELDSITNAQFIVCSACTILILIISSFLKFRITEFKACSFEKG